MDIQAMQADYEERVREWRRGLPREFAMLLSSALVAMLAFAWLMPAFAQFIQALDPGIGSLELNAYTADYLTRVRELAPLVGALLLPPIYLMYQGKPSPPDFELEEALQRAAPGPVRPAADVLPFVPRNRT